MERLWTLIVATCAGTLAGCTAFQKAPPQNPVMTPTTPVAAASAPTTPSAMTRMQDTFKAAVTGEPKAPAPAAEFMCLWQNKLQQLPDPSRAGQMTTGIVGQVFLMQSAEQKNAAADVNGDMVLVVSDATPRNTPSPLKNEVWHFTKDTLTRMIVHDERFGKSVVLFLPWPEHWRDVTRVSVQARYDQPNAATIWAQPTTVVLDYSTGTGGQALPGTGTAYTSVPDPRAVMNSLKTGAPAGTTAVQQTGAWTPPPPSQGVFNGPLYAPPTAPPSPAGLWAPPPPSSQPAPSSAKEFQRLVIPRQ